MASYLDARANGGRWLVRIEDIDTPRVVAGADRIILGQLAALGMHWDAEPVWQSQRHILYQHAFDALLAQKLVYGCACTRSQVPPGRPYPGTCRNGVTPGRHIRAWRFRVHIDAHTDTDTRTPAGVEHFEDRWQGAQAQDVEHETGDFILKRADGLWAYQLVVVVDDGEQGITDVVRGADLLDSTGRQRLLARALGLHCPRVLHVPLVLDAYGHKLSKQNHAAPLNIKSPLIELEDAWQRLGFAPTAAASVTSFWPQALAKWATRFSLDRHAGP